MNIEEVKELSPLDRLCYWIKEREAIRLKKEKRLPKPWTDDAILQSYRFCCVRRMDDKVSQWLLKNWYMPNFDHPHMLYAVALARFINLPSSLSLIAPLVFDGGPDWEGIKTVLRAHREKGNTIFNGAYMVRGNDGMDKIECVVDYYVRPLERLTELNTDSMEETWKLVLDSYGMGSFMAGQIVADLRWAVSGSWEDKNNWAPAGPGSIRGLNRLHERPIKTPLKQERFLTELRAMMKEVRKRIPRSIHGRLEAHDFQNCLCEFDKMERILFEGRRPKSLYPGKG